MPHHPMHHTGWKSIEVIYPSQENYLFDRINNPLYSGVMTTPVANPRFHRIAIAALVLAVPAFANNTTERSSGASIQVDQLVADARSPEAGGRRAEDFR
jgi:hypothetical protein